MKIIVAPDKFKGSLDSMEVSTCIRQGILQQDAEAAVHLFPMSDGGDGFGAIMKYYLGTETVQSTSLDPLMRNITACYERDEANRTAVIELASAAGLVLLAQEERNPLHTSTYGTGLLINNAIERGAKTIVLGLGGSATNDAGIGILAAMGFVFRDEKRNLLQPVGESLLHIKILEPPSSLPFVEFIIACDVTNVLYGREGAAFVYAPQKGADETAVHSLDRGLQHFASVIQLQTAKDIFSFSGSGAAGGVAAGLSAFFDVQVQSGASIVINTSRMEQQLLGTDVIITGEGTLDEQSANGKLVQCVAALGKEYAIPVVAVCGENKLSAEAVAAAGLSAVYPLVNEATTREHALANAASLLRSTAALIAKNHGPGKK